MYEQAIQQARRLPADLRRYRAPQVPWSPHDVSAQYAAADLEALNAGDPAGQRYRSSTEPLEALNAGLARAPESLRARLAAAYGTVQRADSMAVRGVHGIGSWQPKPC